MNKTLITKEDNKKRIGLTMLSVLIVLCLFFGVFQILFILKYKSEIEMLKTSCEGLQANKDYKGVYNGRFYCVQTFGRTQEQISNTENHEICHALIDKSYEHFCLEGRT